MCCELISHVLGKEFLELWQYKTNTVDWRNRVNDFSDEWEDD